MGGEMKEFDTIAWLTRKDIVDHSTPMLDYDSQGDDHPEWSRPDERHPFPLALVICLGLWLGFFWLIGMI